jgi:hypothetical protein
MNCERMPHWDFRMFLIKFAVIILRYEDPVNNQACKEQLG